MDIVGPLPKTSTGFQYLLTIMCTSTRYPEAIPLRSCTAQAVTKALLKFFTQYGVAKTVQTDQGTHFTAKILNQVLKELGCSHVYSVAYHPESQGVLERAHQTLKTMMKMYIHDHEKDWDQGIHFLLFALRDSVQESLGFTPFELIFGHKVRGPLTLLKETCLDDDSEEKCEPNLLTYVTKMKERLGEACRMASENLKSSQNKMKERYDRSSVERDFEVGDKVLVLLPVPGNPLRATFIGPCTVLEKAGDVNYVVSTPDRRKKTQRCHINMLKKYHERKSDQTSENDKNVTNDDTDAVLTSVSTTERDSDFEVTIQPMKLGNSETLENLDAKFQHLTYEQRGEIKALMREYKDLFPDVPGRVEGVFHDVDVGDSRPIKQHPYRVGPQKREAMAKEVKYMLENNIIERGVGPWSSPSILHPKSDGSWRFCTDFRKVNAVTKSDCFPIPRIEDLVDQVGDAKFVTKIDLLKGYWQVPLTERAQEISSFCTPDGLFRYQVMPFGMKNSGSTFQRFMTLVIDGLGNTKVYIDDIIVYSDTWEEHVAALKRLFKRLRKYKATVNLAKSDFAEATVIYLGHVVGQGKVLPVFAKVQSIIDFPVPQEKKSLMRMLGMCGFYRKFCPNFSTVVAPLTGLLKKNVPFEWTEECQKAFENVKKILTNDPVLITPDYNKEFRLYTDSSDVAVGAALMQFGKDGLEHPISYFSRKLLPAQRNYATVEKEALALLLALKHYDVYVGCSKFPVQVFTDHNPLVFVHKMKTENQRLLRWSLTMQEYNLQINHIKGSENVVADALSRP